MIQAVWCFNLVAREASMAISKELELYFQRTVRSKNLREEFIAVLNQANEPGGISTEELARQAGELLREPLKKYVDGQLNPLREQVLALSEIVAGLVQSAEEGEVAKVGGQGKDASSSSTGSSKQKK
jgi:hypothetical protein